MNDDTVFLVSELWVVPDSFQKLKTYRKITNDILEPHKPEYIFHNHAFEWVYGGEGESFPTGIEVVKFENETVARSAIAALDTSELKNMQAEVFSRVRCYFSRYAFPDELLTKLFSQEEKDNI